MRILIIEDDRKIKEFLEISLQAACFAVDCAADGEKGSFIARTNDYDLVICEYFLPEKSSATVCREIRAAGKRMPIIILSESKAIEDKVECFNAGADDYVMKPFSFEELIARIRVILKRAPHHIQGETFRAENIRLETGPQRAFNKEKEVYLTKKEFALLEYLMKNKGFVLSRGLILEHVWNMETNPFSNTIETHIMNLRRKFNDLSKSLIVSIHGRGYKIDAQ